MSRQGRKPELIENLIARGSRTPRIKTHARGNLPACQEPRPDYPPNLKESARPYFDGICAHLESIKRLRAAFAPAVVLLANLQADLDALTEQDRRVSELQARIIEPPAEPTAEQLKALALMDTRANLRRMALTDRIIRLMDRLFMHPESMEGLVIPRNPEDQQPKPGKAPLRPAMRGTRHE